MKKLYKILEEGEINNIDFEELMRNHSLNHRNKNIVMDLAFKEILNEEAWNKTKSSHISKYRYDLYNQKLYVLFPKAAYVYLDVPDEVFMTFKKAKSLGYFLHRNIVNKYPTFMIAKRMGVVLE